MLGSAPSVTPTTNAPAVMFAWDILAAFRNSARILLLRPVIAGELLEVVQAQGPNCNGNKITSIAVTPGNGVQIKEWQ